MTSLKDRLYLTPHSKTVSKKELTYAHGNGRVNLYDSGMPFSFWAEVVPTAIYLRNISPTVQLNDVTPYDGTTKNQMSAT